LSPTDRIRVYSLNEHDHDEGPLARPFVIQSTVMGHDGKACVTVIEAETDGVTGFEAGGGEPAVGDQHPREIRLSVWLRRPWIGGVSQEAAAMFVLALVRFAGLAWFCLKMVPGHDRLSSEEWVVVSGR
jgi:hypothetical protein